MAGAGVTQTEAGASDLEGRRLGHLAHQDIQIDYLGGTNPIYVGWAEPGSLTSAPVWRIAFLTYDLNGNPLTMRWASGSIAYAFIWDNRTTFTYL